MCQMFVHMNGVARGQTVGYDLDVLTAILAWGRLLCDFCIYHFVFDNF
jgi:hypothetical protein